MAGPLMASAFNQCDSVIAAHKAYWLLQDADTQCRINIFWGPKHSKHSDILALHRLNVYPFIV